MNDMPAVRHVPLFALGDTMKASFAAVCASAAVVLVSAWAETRTVPTLHPDSLARYETITSYCEKADPDSASLYAARLASLTRGLTRDDLSNDRNSASYHQAMDQAHVVLSKASDETGMRGCNEFLAKK
jgi:hypothetical protein